MEEKVPKAGGSQRASVHSNDLGPCQSHLEFAALDNLQRERAWKCAGAPGKYPISVTVAMVRMGLDLHQVILGFHLGECFLGEMTAGEEAPPAATRYSTDEK